MKKSERDRYWTELIWVCRVGCLSDVVVTEKWKLRFCYTGLSNRYNDIILIINYIRRGGKV